MKKLILSALVVMGLALAQAPYVGGHIGLRGGPTWTPPLNGGIHVGAGLRDGLEVRGGVDFTPFLKLRVDFTLALMVILGVNGDLLMNLGTIPGYPVLPYVGLGGYIQLSSSGNVPGVHATLGIKYPISGTRDTLFLEVQPGLAFAQGGSTFGYRLKAGVNYGF